MKKSTFIILIVICTTLFVGTTYGKTREDCRASTDQEIIIQCIEEGLYDPCDDAGGSWGRAQCGWAHAEIADRKVKKAEQEITNRLKKGKKQRQALINFQLSQKQWRSFRESYCKFTNQAVEISQFEGSTFFHLGFCWRRLTEQRAEELQTILHYNE